MAKKIRMPREGEIPVWLVEVLDGSGYVPWHVRLSDEVAKGLEGKLRKLLAGGKISGFQISKVVRIVVPAFQFYARYGLDG